MNNIMTHFNPADRIVIPWPLPAPSVASGRDRTALTHNYRTKMAKQYESYQNNVSHSKDNNKQNDPPAPHPPPTPQFFYFIFKSQHKISHQFQVMSFTHTKLQRGRDAHSKGVAIQYMLSSAIRWLKEI